MLTAINPKLPMRDKSATKHFYIDKLGFTELADYNDYLILYKDNIEIHFFTSKGLDPKENDGQVYIRTDDIEILYQNFRNRAITIHPNAELGIRPWGQKEFALLDPDNNLLTFGQAIV